MLMVHDHFDLARRAQDAARVARPGAAPALPLRTPRTRHASPIVAQRGTHGQRDRSVTVRSQNYRRAAKGTDRELTSSGVGLPSAACAIVSTATDACKRPQIACEQGGEERHREGSHGVQIRCRACVQGGADQSDVTWCTETAEKEAVTSSAQQRWHRPGIEQHQPGSRVAVRVGRHRYVVRQKGAKGGTNQHVGRSRFVGNGANGGRVGRDGALGG
eukprot:scaffold31954_cov66-Phaeocystis_antarctica.AAC.4